MYTQDKKKIEQKMRKEYPPLKTARELEWGFKIRYAVVVVLSLIAYSNFSTCYSLFVLLPRVVLFTCKRFVVTSSANPLSPVQGQNKAKYCFYA